MGPTVAATVYGVFALVAAWVFRPRAIDNPAILRGAIFWLLSTPIMFMIPLTMASLAVCGALLVALTPKAYSDRAALYFLSLLAIPPAIRADIPFPGINHLITLDFPEVAFLVLLLPAMIAAPAPLLRRHAPAIGVFVILYALYLFAQEFRGENFTTSLRGGVTYFLLYAAPFLALIRLVNTESEFDRIFSCLIFVAVIFFFAALVSQATRWNFYTYLIERTGQFEFADVRHGMLRVSVTVNTVLAGYILGMGLLAVEYFHSQRRIGAAMAWLYRVMLIGAAYMTYSRGAWIAIVAGLFVYYFFTKAPRMLRPAMLAVLAVGMIPAGFYVVTGADFSEIDAYGTFSYRQELLQATFVHLQQFPFFGDPQFYGREHFAHLLQGQGIIDFVNLYVQIVVRYGVIGLILFLAPWILLILGLLRLGGKTLYIHNPQAEQRRALVLALVISYLTLMATTSGVSNTLPVGVALLSLGAAYLAAARHQLATAHASEPAAASVGDLHAA